MKEKVTVSRQWHHPEINIFVDTGCVGAGMSLQDFIKAMSDEVGNPTMLVTKTQLNIALNQAAERVIQEMKKKTAEIV